MTKYDELIGRFMPLRVSLNTSAGMDDPETIYGFQVLLDDVETTLTDLQAQVAELRGALVTAIIPIEVILLSGAIAAHCQDVRDALHDAKTTARQALEKSNDKG